MKVVRATVPAVLLLSAAAAQGNAAGCLPATSVVPGAALAFQRTAPPGLQAVRSRDGRSALNPRPHASELDAVRAAADAFNPHSIRDDREFMGGILRHGGRFYYTVSLGHPGQDRVTARIPLPRHARIVAFWHTHGAEADDRRYFSDIDTELARAWGLPFYLADHTGELKVFTPGDATLSPVEARDRGLPERTGLATGRLVSNIHGEPIRIRTADEFAVAQAGT